MAPRYLYVTADAVLYRFTREAWRRYLAEVARNDPPDLEGHATVLYVLEADVTGLPADRASEMLVQSFHEPAAAS